jgi:hypothetical protein
MAAVKVESVSSCLKFLAPGKIFSCGFLSPVIFYFDLQALSFSSVRASVKDAFESLAPLPGFQSGKNLNHQFFILFVDFFPIARKEIVLGTKQYLYNIIPG